MAEVDDLVGKISDDELRSDIEDALRRLKDRQRFGIVFEEHQPETVSLVGQRPGLGELAVDRSDGSAQVGRVLAAEAHSYVFEYLDGSQSKVAAPNAVAVRRFGEPVFPSLRSVGRVVSPGGNASETRNLVINAENYHALQLLTYTCGKKVDCIYIDPPYNTGARDWKYNNRIVDENDRWRHSKWLSMMDKRLRLARGLLKDDSALIVTIDQNEVAHLGLLLERVFPNARKQLVTIVIGPSGQHQAGFSRVEEFAYFLFFGEREAQPIIVGESETEEGSEAAPSPVSWDSLLRRGTDALPSDRPTMVYPILVDRTSRRIVGTGASLPDLVASGEVGDLDDAGMDKWVPPSDDGQSAHVEVWPVRKNGRLGRWRVSAGHVEELREAGHIRSGKWNKKRARFAISYLGRLDRERIETGELQISGHDPDTGVAHVVRPGVKTSALKTVWADPRHNAGKHGTELLSELLGERKFDYPKSVYAVQDCLRAAVGDIPNALILDFFAGSATTMHATALLNAEDGGTRRSICVTNNEVGPTQTTRLHSEGLYQGDLDFERHGIFESVAKPRCEAVVSGRSTDGAPLQGEYEGGRPMSDGMQEAVEFMSLEYLDADSVELGMAFDQIHPLLWLASGCQGEPPTDACPTDTFYVSPSLNYGVLFLESQFAEFAARIKSLPDLSSVWLVTNSEFAFAEMREMLPRNLEVSMLYRDYLRNFEINTPERAR